jgi:hypothetical protein
MKSQTPELNIGDKIGFVIQANGIDENDRVIFFPVVEVTTRDGERAYRYQFPDGSTSMAAIRQSDLASHAVQIEPQVSPKMICLSERKAEFTEALNRGKDNRFEVFADWDRDAFVVVNLDNKAEYRVKLETHREQLFASCDCPDFTFRKRICKHASEVLTNALLMVKV